MARNKKVSTYRKYTSRGKTVEAKTMGKNLVRCKEVPVHGNPSQKLLDKIEETLENKAGIETIDFTPSGAVLLGFNLKKAGMNFNQFMKSVTKDIVDVIEGNNRFRTSPGSIPRSSKQSPPYLNQTALAT